MIVSTTWISLRRPLLERRTQRPVDQPAGEDGVLGWPALAAEERAGDPARGVHPLFDVDRQREEVEVVLGLLGRRRGGQHHGLVVEVGDGGTGRLPGKPAGLEPDRTCAERAVVDDGFGECIHPPRVEPPWFVGPAMPGTSLRTARRRLSCWDDPACRSSIEAPGTRCLQWHPGGHYRGPAPYAAPVRRDRRLARAPIAERSGCCNRARRRSGGAPGDARYAGGSPRTCGYRRRPSRSIRLR